MYVDGIADNIRVDHKDRFGSCNRPPDELIWESRRITQEREWPPPGRRPKMHEWLTLTKSQRIFIILAQAHSTGYEAKTRMVKKLERAEKA